MDLRPLPGADVRMRVVVLELEIFVPEIKYRSNGAVQTHGRQRTRNARELQSSLIGVILVQVSVAKRMNELAWFQICDLSNHQG